MQTETDSTDLVGRSGTDVEETFGTDHDLLRRFAHGDREALSEIISRHEVAVRRVLIGLWEDRHEVDDFCQEVFLRFIERPPVLSPTQELGPWLYRTALNLVRDRARRRRVRQWFRLVERPGRRREFESETSADVKAQEREHVVRLHDEIRRLRPAWREVVVLRDLMGLPPDETAGVLGTTTKAVTDRLHRARRELARQLDLGSERESE